MVWTLTQWTAAARGQNWSAHTAKEETITNNQLNMHTCTLYIDLILPFLHMKDTQPCITLLHGIVMGIIH